MTRVIPFANAVAAYSTTSQHQRSKPLSIKTTSASVREVGLTSPVDRLDLSAAIKATHSPTHPLAAAKINQAIDFDSIPAPARSAANPVAINALRNTAAKSAVPKPPVHMPFYTNPALRNVAATRIAQGTTLDIQA